MQKALILILFMIVGNYSKAQQYTNPEYYLISNLILSNLNEEDSILLETELKKFHTANHDTTKAQILNYICDEMRNDYWKDYQYLAYDFIQRAIALHNNEIVQRSLKKQLAGAVNNIGYIHKHEGELDKGLKYYLESLEIELSLGNQKGIGESYNNIGAVYAEKGEIVKALDYYKLGLKIRMNQLDSMGIAESYNNIAYVYKDQGNIPEALEMFHSSMKILKQLNSDEYVAVLLNNIGLLYQDQKEYETALEYFNESLAIRKKLNSPIDMVHVYNNLGFLHRDMEQDSIALKYFNDCLLLLEKEEGYKEELSTIYNNMALVYDDNKHSEQALKYFLMSLEIEEEIGSKGGLSLAYNNVGGVYYDLRKINIAKEYALKGISLAQEVGYPYEIKLNAKLMYKIFKREGDFKKAIEMYELYIQMNDSITSTKNQKAAIRQQTKYEFEKAQLVAEQRRNEELRIQNEKLERRNNLQYSVIFIAILGVFGMVLALGKISVSPKVAEGLIFFAFLILFEFLLVLSDPYVDSFTNGEPIHKLLANAVLAGAIFPAHSFFERVLKKRLIDNKKNV